MTEKYGFIYIWRDRKHNRYYVGNHWGNENDGYICSSTWMKQAYKSRSEDFKRRVLERTSDKNKLNEMEHRWLQMMKPEELKGKRYYNFHNYRFGHWSTGDVRSVVEKIHTPERAAKVSAKMKGKNKTRDHRDKISQTLIRKHEMGLIKKPVLSESQRLQRSEQSKRLQREKRIGMIGKKHNEETRDKMSFVQSGINNPMFGKHHDAVAKEKIRSALTNRKIIQETRSKLSSARKKTAEMKRLLKAGSI